MSGAVPAGPAFAGALAALHAEAFAGGEIWGADAFAEQLGVPGTRAWIDPAGGFVVIRAVADQADILTIGVAPAARRQGVGRHLLETALAWAKQVGVNAAFLEVAADDPIARDFYARLGFKQVGRRAAYYASGADALVLSIKLSVE